MSGYKETALKESCFRPGSTLCPGCMEAVAFQNVGRVTDNGVKTIFTIGTSCAEVSTLAFPNVVAWGRGDAPPDDAAWERSLAAFRDSLPQVVNTPELRFPCPEERKKPVIEEVRARLAATGAEVDPIDGVRVRDGRGWWLLRASNTQDVLVARCEAEDEEALRRLRATLTAQLAESGIEAREA